LGALTSELAKAKTGIFAIIGVEIVGLEVPGIRFTYRALLLKPVKDLGDAALRVQALLDFLFQFLLALRGHETSAQHPVVFEPRVGASLLAPAIRPQTGSRFAFYLVVKLLGCH